MLYVVLVTFAAGMATEYFLGNRWIGFFAAAYRLCLYFFLLGINPKTCGLQKKKREKRAKRKES